MARALQIEPPNVLVVDDDPEFARLLAVGLSTGGFRVHVGTSAEASAILDAEHIDLAIIDLDLCHVAVWDLLERLRVEYPAVLPFIVSGNVDVPKAVNAMRAGAVDVLQKPIRLDALEVRLREELARGRHAEMTPRSGEMPRPKVSPGVQGPPEARGTGRIIGRSPSIARVREQIVGIARFNQVATLIVGETGTGKEVVARALHEISAPGKPLVTINCAAIPETLFESELFGHEAGSFTGARGAKVGLLESAADGTILLDEVGEMALAMQPKLLRVLQDRTFRRVGGSRDIELRARIISATNRKLSAARQDGMRSDLYFRLAGFTIVLPPLRHRKEDIELLATEFLREFACQYPGVASRWSSDAMARLLEHAFRGNVRELKRVVEQAAVLSQSSIVERAAVDFALREDTGGSSLPPPGSVRESRSFRITSSPMRLEGAPSVRSLEDPNSRSPGVLSSRADHAPSGRSLEAPSVRSLEAPSVRSLEAPSVRSLEAPSSRSPDAPSSRSLEAPSSRSLEAPSSRSLEAPSSRSRVPVHEDAGLNEVQQRMILDAYEANARNLTRAARALRIPRTTLRDRLKRYGWL